MSQPGSSSSPKNTGNGSRRGTQALVFAIGILLAVVLGGTVGYMEIEGWSAWDAFYMSAITVTTVGYREVHEMSTAGQALTVVLLFFGVGSALYVFTLMAALVVEGGLPQQIQKRRQARMLNELTDHFIVCGYGRIGSIIAAKLRQQGVPFVIVERDAERLEAAMMDGCIAVQADASHEDVLKRVGVDRARGLIAAVGTDAENVYTVLSARVLRPDLFIVGRAEGDDAARKLMRAGANRVVSPYQIGAAQMAQTAIRPAVVDFVELATSSDNLELAMEEITIAGASSLVDRSILDANLRQRFGVIVVAIQRQDRHMDFNPEPDTAIRSGDKLVVLGRPHSLRRLEVEAEG
ncbi:MAG: TrkA family potassium uptake protein [Vicinamibacterales bacterium]